MMISLGFDLLKWMTRKTFAKQGWVIMFSSVVLIRKLKEGKKAQYWDTDEQDLVKTSNRRKIGLSTCSAGKSLLANLLKQSSAWAVSPRLWARLRHHNCTKALWPRAAGPGQLCAGQTQAGFSLPLLALQSQLGCDTHPWGSHLGAGCQPSPGQRWRLPGALAPQSCPYRSWKTGSTSAAGAQPFHCQQELKAAIF